MENYDSNKIYFDSISKNKIFDRNEELKVASKMRDSRNNVVEAIITTPEILDFFQEKFQKLIQNGYSNKFVKDEDTVTSLGEIENIRNLLRESDTKESYEIAILGMKNFLSNFTYSNDGIREIVKYLVKNSSDVQKINFISKKLETLEYCKKILVQSNLRLVVAVARKYQSDVVDIADMIQEGNLGLMRAADRYDHRRGHKFSTYATWWIRQSISRSLMSTKRTVRVPTHIIELSQKIDRARKNHLSQFGHVATDEQISTALGMEVDKIVKVDMAIMSHNITSMSDEHEDHILSVIDGSPLPDKKMELTELSKKFEELLEGLTQQESDILRMRFGMGKYTPMTLEEIGNIYQVTRERIRQIEAKAIGKLQHPSKIKVLKEFYR